MKLKITAKKWLRDESGFSLATIMCLGVCAGMVLLSTAQLMSVSAAKVTNERVTDVMRASAESGLDWAVQQLSNTSTREALDSGAAVSIPSEYLHALGGNELTGTVVVSNVAAPKTSYLYNDRLDPSVTANNITGGNAWRVLTATVSNGIKTKSVRVMLKPVYETFTNSIITTTTSNGQIIVTSTALVNGQPQPLFVKSMFGKGMISFSGNNASTNSYDSAVNANPSTFHSASSGANKGYGDVGSNAGAAIGNGNIGGSVTVTAGAGQGTVSVGSNGSVVGSITSSGTVSGSATGGVTSGTGATPQVLPDAPSAPSGASNLGAISLTGNSQYTIPAAGNYIMSSLSIAGNGKLNVPSSGIVNIYVQGAGSSISIAGNGINNPSGLPSNVRIWYSGSSEVSVGGNGVMKAVIYAPNANVKFNGNGAMYGAVVGNAISVVGNGVFHYDEALGRSDQLTWTPKVTTTITTTTNTIITSTVTTTSTAQNVKNFQAVSWMEF